LLTDKNITKIFSSDLGRCMQTSKIVNQKLNVGIIYTQELREQNFGDFNGKPADIIIRKFDLSDPTLVFPNGESFNQMKKRVLHFIYQLNQEKPVLIVTHEGCLRAIISGILNVDFSSEKCKTEGNQIFMLDISKRKIIRMN
jgi:broad specificity phosphatase PhoE